ncbi:hypothetical protein ABDK00_005520 [Niabella insulamsoli]|uniref:hypothetical protein n=1 Tax=Niabella insulamsoli TaxID=3144874 RepID=UPI0031FC211F
MKRNFLLTLAVSVSFTTASLAQVSTTPETPRNYKPQPKELAPMPGELTDEMIFPVLGQYEFTDKEGNVTPVTITRDSENKGVVWVNGMPDGKFKADLRVSPATYKIPSQKTLQNDIASVEASTETTRGVAASEQNRYSGKSLNGGTLLFDSASNKLYVNVGGKFDEENPTAIFPELMASDSVMYNAAADMEENNAVAKQDMPRKSDKKKEKAAHKGTTYILTKVVEMAAAPVGELQ